MKEEFGYTMYMYMYCFYIITKKRSSPNLSVVCFSVVPCVHLCTRKLKNGTTKCGGRLHDTIIKFSKVAWNYVA